MALLVTLTVLLMVVFVRWFYGSLAPSQPTTEGAPDAQSRERAVPEPRTPPLDFEGFDPGLIISDDVFYDSSTMDASDIEAFLDNVNYGCREGAAPCITDYREDSPTYDADDYCHAFQGQADDSAASIIDKAAKACGVNPQVLLVMLQKEQGLLTASSYRLNETRYKTAMGYGCPDNADCSPAYFGFANQVYYAARQLRRYANEPHMYQFMPNEASEVAFNPNPDCGSSLVEIENYATAGLYNYTPYQPGGVPGCESAGNLNFYAYFNAWFGE